MTKPVEIYQIKQMNQFYAKDFIETAEGLLFAVVKNGIERGRVLCFLRYVQTADGWQKYKYPSAAANQFLQQHHPEYLYDSPILNAQLHAVPLERIVRHYQPQQRLQQLLQSATPDPVESDLLALCALLQQHGLNLAQTGVTGSVLLGLQNPSSDIDFVCYDHTVFQHCRMIVAELLQSGQLQELSEQTWLETYNLRPRALSFSDYLWHERRKNTKLMINGRNIDFTFIERTASADPHCYHKCGEITLQCSITDDTRAFAFPTEFKINHPQFHSIVCFIGSYAGQAMSGETVEVAGTIEENELGEQRVVLGSSREARTEYMKVLHS